MVNIVEIVVRSVNDTKKGLDEAKGDFNKAGKEISSSLKPIGLAFAGSGLLSMAAPLGAAGLAMGAFAAIAAPTLSKVDKALTTTGKAGQKAWAQLDPAQRGIAQNIQGLQKAFDQTAKALEPMVTSVLGLGVKIAHDLMPALSTLGSAGGTAIKAILTPLDKLVKSGSFTTFINSMATFAKQAAPLIGTLLVGALKILMQLMEQLAPIGLQLLKSFTPLFLSVLASAIPVVKALATALADVLTPLSKYAPVMGPLILGIYGMIKAVQLAKGVWIALNAILDVNPFILIGTALIALTLIIIKYHKQIWDAIVKTWDDVKNFVVKIWGDILGFAKQWWPLLLGPGGVILKYHQQIIQGIEAAWRTVQSFLSGIWNSIKSVASTVWGAIWGTIKSVTSGGIGTMMTLIKGIPGAIKNALSMMFSIGSAVMGDLWNGIKAGAKSIVGWLSQFAKSVVNVFKTIWGWFSPSRVMYEGGKSLMDGLAGGIKDHAHQAIANSQQVANAAVNGVVGGDEAANKKLAQKMFPWPKSMWSSFDYLEMREAGYNRFARNPSSGAYGIPQALPPTKMPFAAQAAGGSHAGAQLSWMFDYIRQVYGNPVNAAAHKRQFNWYAGGGPTAAGWAVIGEHGRELVKLPGGSTVYPHGATEAMVGGGGAVNITLEIQGGSNSPFDALMLQWLREKVRVKGGGNVQRAFGRN